jgi:hypothetical protein
MLGNEHVKQFFTTNRDQIHSSSIDWDMLEEMSEIKTKYITVQQNYYTEQK